MTARDIEKAEALIKYCMRTPGNSFRGNLIDEIAALMAENRKLKAKKAK